MKAKLFFFLLFLTVCSCRAATAQQEKAVSDINWQEKEHLLTYNLSKDSRVKIRIGLYLGPVYRTIVNLEKRSQGKNQEQWDGKDKEGKIDFLKYGKLHFCVDVPVKPRKDSLLKVKFSEGANLLKDPITVDVQEDLKAALFTKDGGELRVYLDNQLEKIERVNSLPYTFNLKIDNIPAGNHLLTINLWTALDFGSVAYRSFEVSTPKGKSQTSVIAFCQQDKDGFWQVFTSLLDGKNAHQLTGTPEDKRYPSWSADGGKLAYVNNSGELWIMDANGSGNRRIPLPISCSEPRFSPDAKKIIFTSPEDVYHGSAKIWEVDLDNLELKKLVNRPWLQYNPAYSPDGTQIIFTDGPELFEQDIRKLDLKSGEITQITDNGPYDYDMQAAFLHSGQEIVYSTNEGSSDYEIYKMDKFGRDKINLSRSPNSCDIMPAASLDDKTIYFLSDRSGKMAIWKMNIDGSQVRKITKNETDISSFSIYTD